MTEFKVGDYVRVGKGVDPTFRGVILAIRDEEASRWGFEPGTVFVQWESGIPGWTSHTILSRVSPLMALAMQA